MLATQNPIEQEGTYPLPEAQLDRFMFMVLVDYPTLDEERLIVRSTTTDVEGRAAGSAHRRGPAGPPADRPQDPRQPARGGLRGEPRPRDQARPTGPPPTSSRTTSPGAPGPRAAQYLVLGAKSRALLHGRFNVSTEDVRAVAHPVLRHRIFTNFNADAEGVSADRVVDMLIQAVPEPRVEDYQNVSVAGPAQE